MPISSQRAANADHARKASHEPPYKDDRGEEWQQSKRASREIPDEICPTFNALICLRASLNFASST